MKKTYVFKILGCGLILLGLVAGPTFAAISVSDLLDQWDVTPGPYGASDWEPITGVHRVLEDNDPTKSYVGPGVGGQEYDVEAIYYGRAASAAYFAVVSGFPLEGRGNNWAGDFAIDIGSDASYEFGVEMTGNWGNAVQAELFLNPTWGPPMYAQHSTCSPFEILNADQGSSLGVVDFGYDKTSYINDGHYAFALGIPVSLFGSYWGDGLGNPQFTAHWTMRCGNDCLDLEVPMTAQPEPATLLLLGTGLGLAFLRRKKRR